MATNHPVFLSVKYLLLFMIVCGLSACTRVPVKPPVETGIQIKPPESVTKIEQPKLSAIETLMAEAKNFTAQGNYQDALFIYNQALSQASEDQKPGVMYAIEMVLAKTPTQTIEEFIQIKNIHIPQPILLFWLALNYATDNHMVKSREILDAFLSQYPDHPYHADAADLLNDLKKQVFDRHTIGCLLPLTGKYAIFGQRALTGIQLAVQELSNAYDRPFNLIIKDTQANPDVTVACVRQLYEKNVAAIIGPLLMVNEAGQEAEKLQIPLIALTQKTDFALSGEYLFSNFITPEMQVKTLGDYLFLNLGIKKVAILYPNEKYGQKYMDLFWDIVDKHDGEVVGVEVYDGAKTDFAEPIQKLTGQFFPIPDFLKPDTSASETETELNNTPVDKEPEPDDTENVSLIKKEEEKIQIDFEALFIPDSPSRLNMILPQLAYYDARGMYLVGTNLWHDDALLKDVKGYNKQAVIADGFFDGSQNPATREFTKKFEAVFHIKPKFLEAISYDNAFILFSVVMDETIDSRKSLKDALKSQRIFTGVTGNTFFDKDGAAHRDLFLMTIKKGQFVEINR